MIRDSEIFASRKSSFFSNFYSGLLIFPFVHRISESPGISEITRVPYPSVFSKRRSPSLNAAPLCSTFYPASP